MLDYELVQKYSGCTCVTVCKNCIKVPYIVLPEECRTERLFWHNMKRKAESAKLSAAFPDPYVE